MISPLSFMPFPGGVFAPLSFANLAKSVRPPFCLFFVSGSTRFARGIEGCFARIARVERMPRELGGIVHGTGSRIASACLVTVGQCRSCVRPRTVPDGHAL